MYQTIVMIVLLCHKSVWKGILLRIWGRISWIILWN